LVKPASFRAERASPRELPPIYGTVAWVPSDV